MNRRTFLTTLLAATASPLLLARQAHAIGPGSQLEVGVLRYGGNFDPRPTALRRMLQEVEKRTSIAIAPRTALVDPLDRDALFSHPLLFWAGDRAFDPLPDAARANLGAWLGAGGTLVIDSAEGRVGGPFEEAARREVAAMLPGRRFVAVPRSHVLYKSFYLIPEPVGRVAVAQTMEGVFGEDRALVLLSHNDLLGAWARDNLGNYEYDVFPGGDRQREMALRLGINIIMYNLCINYKEDQVHVPFILKRRKWKVE